MMFMSELTKVTKFKLQEQNKSIEQKSHVLIHIGNEDCLTRAGLTKPNTQPEGSQQFLWLCFLYMRSIQASVILFSKQIHHLCITYSVCYCQVLEPIRQRSGQPKLNSYRFRYSG